MIQGGAIDNPLPPPPLVSVHASPEVCFGTPENRKPGKTSLDRYPYH